MLISHLSQSGLALEEIGVLAALGRGELGVEECAAIGYGLQGGGTLIGEGQTHKQLCGRENNSSNKNPLFSKNEFTVE